MLSSQFKLSKKVGRQDWGAESLLLYLEHNQFFLHFVKLHPQILQPICTNRPSTSENDIRNRKICGVWSKRIKSKLFFFHF